MVMRIEKKIDIGRSLKNIIYFFPSSSFPLPELAFPLHSSSILPSAGKHVLPSWVTTGLVVCW